MKDPSRIPILHMTHIDNLSSIIADGFLWSDKIQLAKKHCNQEIGLSHVKQRRLNEIEVACHPGTMVGDYVPFYFHVHAPMLYYIHKRGDELGYKGGQEDIVYLVSKMSVAINWAEENEKKWAFTNGNAGAYLCDFYNKFEDLDKVNWEAVKQRYWSDCKDAKQAEFLVYEQFSWNMFESIGVYDAAHQGKVERIIVKSAHKPIVKVKAGWYY